jgi:hypothetical protein
VVVALLPVLAAAAGLGRAVACPLEVVARMQDAASGASASAREPVACHCRGAHLAVVAALQGWPTEQQLLALMRTRPGEAVAYQVWAQSAKRKAVYTGRTMCRFAKQSSAAMQDGPAVTQHFIHTETPVFCRILRRIPAGCCRPGCSSRAGRSCSRPSGPASSTRPSCG